MCVSRCSALKKIVKTFPAFADGQDRSEFCTGGEQGKRSPPFVNFGPRVVFILKFLGSFGKRRLVRGSFVIRISQVIAERAYLDQQELYEVRILSLPSDQKLLAFCKLNFFLN